uniref:Uncharacterized protein n=1 Tax=Heterorhabditis bacteriophora TaxID=37862 RepID=A0A1I7WQK9_HETBA
MIDFGDLINQNKTARLHLLVNVIKKERHRSTIFEISYNFKMKFFSDSIYFSYYWIK